MKILETIQGAVQNTVIYLDDSGEKKVKTFPSVCKIEDFIAGLDKEKSAGKAEETPAAQKTVFDAPERDSDAIPAKEGISGRKIEPSARGAKK